MMEDVMGTNGQSGGSFLPPQAVEFLDSVQAEQDAKNVETARNTAKQELLDYCRSWLDSAQAWRKSSFEETWRIYSQHADGIYDPVLANKKKDWQSKAFYPLIPNHRETIHASIYVLMAGTNPPLEVSHGPGGLEETAGDVRDLVVRELQKSRYVVGLDRVLSDADTYGSGFAKVRWEKRIEKRTVKKPILEPLRLDPAAYVRKLQGIPKVIGYNEVEEDVVNYNGIMFDWVNIYDIFPDPMALSIEGNPIAQRHYLTLGKIKKGVEEGQYLLDAYDLLENEKNDQTQPQEKIRQDSDRGIYPGNVERPKLVGERECFDLYAQLPKKWIYPLLPGPMEYEKLDEDEPIAAVVRFHKKALVGVFLNDSYNGEPAFVKLDYTTVAGRYYGRGICEMLSGAQDVVNEVVNQRLDNGNLALNKGFAVIEKALINPKDIIECKPGFVARLDAKVLGPNGDVRQAFQALDLGDIKPGAGFTEIGEWERVAQERTSANRTVMGTGAQAGDINRTATAQIIQKESAGEKFKYIGMVMEFDALKHIYRKFYELIYKNLDPQEVVWALGEERAARFLANVPNPDDVNRQYIIEPQGIFGMSNKADRQVRLQTSFQQFAAYPWIKPSAFFDEIIKSGGDDPAPFRMSDVEMQAQAQQMIAMQTQVPTEGPQMPQEMPMGMGDRDGR